MVPNPRDFRLYCVAIEMIAGVVIEPIATGEDANARTS
jgi:hypothetical protein